MIQVHIECRPEEIDEHLKALGFMRRPFVGAQWEAVPEVVTESLADLLKNKQPEKVEEQAGTEERAKAEEPKKPAGRRGRPPANPATVLSPKTAAAIDLQDAADEAAESAARKAEHGDAPTHDDLRTAFGRYMVKFGPEAGVKNIRAILGSGIEAVPTDKIVETIAKIDGLIASGKPLPDAAPISNVPIPEPQPPTESLFDDKPAERAPYVSTRAEVNAIARSYGARYDGTDDPNKMTFAKEDLPKILHEAIGLTSIIKIPGDQPEMMGKAYLAFKHAIETNPFKREVRA